MSWAAIAGGTIAAVGSVGAAAMSNNSGGGSSTSQVTSNVPSYANYGIQHLWNQTLERMYPGINESMYPTDPNVVEQVAKRQALLDEYKALNNGSTAEPSADLSEFLTRNNLSLDADEALFQSKIYADPSLSPSANPSYEQKLANDWGEKEAAQETYNTGVSDLNAGTLQKSQEAVTPYTNLLEQYIKQGNEGTGLFTPFSFGAGGKKMASFVPRPNRALASQLTGFAADAAQNKTNLIGLENSYGVTDLINALNTAQKYTTNAAETDYIENQLKPLAMKLVFGQGSASTRNTETEAPTDTWSDVLAGALAGSNVYANYNKYSGGAKTDPGTTPVDTTPSWVTG